MNTTIVYHRAAGNTTPPVALRYLPPRHDSAPYHISFGGALFTVPPGGVVFVAPALADWLTTYRNRLFQPVPTTHPYYHRAFHGALARQQKVQP